jgi:hypothetical protein
MIVIVACRVGEEASRTTTGVEPVAVVTAPMITKVAVEFEALSSLAVA